MRKAPILNAATADRIEAHNHPGGLANQLYGPPGRKSRRKNMEIYKIANREFPVLETLNVHGHSIPLLDIRMMSDERERELARKEGPAA